LHTGRWANVFLAHPSGSLAAPAADYVLKLADLAAMPSAERAFAQARLIREATVARQVSHPHLVPVLAGEVQAETAWIVEPYCGSRTLREEVNQPSSPPQMLWLVRQTCEALQALHAAGWLHGDVCPENVVVSAEGHATLIDLAFARRLRSAECAIASTPFSGRTIYAAPEAFAEQGELQASADMYSLGVLLFEMLVGTDPFYEYAGEEILAAKRLLAAPDIREFEPETPFALAQLVNRLLSREPLRRPSASEAIEQFVALEIESFLQWR
jgi:serine/threonine-protein kinase